MHADGHYPPMICRVQCRCYWMMQMLICIKINSYARNIKETENMNKRQKILIVDDAKFKEERRTLILQSVFFLHISRLKKNILKMYIILLRRVNL